MNIWDKAENWLTGRSDMNQEERGEGARCFHIVSDCIFELDLDLLPNGSRSKSDWLTSIQTLRYSGHRKEIDKLIVKRRLEE